MWDFFAWSGIIAWSLIALGAVAYCLLYAYAKYLGMPD